MFQKPGYLHHYAQNHEINKEKSQPNVTQDMQDQMNKLSNIHTVRAEENENIKDFAVSKNDPKYQTLPYNTKFTVNLLTNRISKADQYGNSGSNSNDINKDDTSNYISNHINGNFNLQSTHMTVHSAPLSILNKNIATPLNQHDLLVRKNSEDKDQSVFNETEESSQKLLRDNTYPAPTSISTSVTTTYQVRITLLQAKVMNLSILKNFIYCFFLLFLRNPSAVWHQLLFITLQSSPTFIKLHLSKYNQLNLKL